MMTRKTTLWLFLGLWILLYALSVVVPMNMAPTGDGFTRGADRVLTFLSLQFAASLMAFLILLVRPRRGPLSGLSLLPVALCGVLVLGLAGVIAFALLT